MTTFAILASLALAAWYLSELILTAFDKEMYY